MKFRALVATLLALALAPIVALTASPARAADGPVTFPSVTAFNPRHYVYSFDVADIGLDSIGTTLYATENGDLGTRTELPKTGSVTWKFHLTGPYFTDLLTIERCGLDGTCTEIQRSPDLLLVSGIPVGASVGRTYGPGRHPVLPLYVMVPRQIRSVRARWQVTGKSGRRVASGASTLRPHANGAARLRLDLPRGNLPASLRVAIAVRADGGTSFGVLTGSTRPRIGFDDDFAMTARAAQARFFPAHDHFRDTETVTFRSHDRIRGLRASVVDRRGHVVRSHLPTRGASVRWDGRDNHRHLVRAGTYRVVARAHDPRGNAGRASVRVRVSRAKLVWKTWHTSISPARSLLNASVGSCSTLKKLSGGGLGLYSQTSCRDAQQSVVVAIHGAYVPHGLAFRRVRVDVDGGAAAGAVHPYVVLGYIDAGNSFTYRKQFDGSHGVHHGATAGASIVHDVAKAKPFLVWELGLTGGSRYDVKRYALSLQYRTLS